MDTRRWAFGAAIWLAVCATVGAEDVVKAGKLRYSGKIVQITSLDVTVATAVKNEKVPVNQIEGIEFEEDPPSLKKARSLMASDRDEDALAALQAIKVAGLSRAEVRQDVEFCIAAVTSRLALSGAADLAEARKLMADFVAKYPQNYHALQANETLGEMLLADLQYAEARKCFERLGQAPWPDYQMRAHVAVGQILLAENKPQEAIKSFDSALAMSAADPATQAQRWAATLGRARCLAETKRADEAVKIAQDAIAKADPDDAWLLARAYTTLGVALKRAGRTQEALFAFLHVDTLYSSEADAHAEALYHLVQVWQDLKKFGRAQETQRALEEQYKQTRWFKALGK